MVLSPAERNRMLREMRNAENGRLQRMVAHLPAAPTHRVPHHDHWRALAQLPAAPTHRAVSPRTRALSYDAAATLNQKMRRIQEMQRQLRRQRRRWW